MMPGEAHPACDLCASNGPCAFHRAATPEGLARAFLDAMKKRGGLGLSDFYLSAFAAVTDMPAQLDAVSHLPTKALESLFVKLLEKPEFNTNDLRAIAATALALATIYDAREDTDDGT